MEAERSKRPLIDSARGRKGLWWVGGRVCGHRLRLFFDQAAGKPIKSQPYFYHVLFIRILDYYFFMKLFTSCCELVV